MEYKVDVLISKEKIADRVKELAKTINKEFDGEEVVLIGLLRGSVIFLSDLAREIDLDAKIDFMIVSSYGNTMESSREVKIIKDLEEYIEGKNVIIVEDIIDTGYTLQKVVETLKLRNPKELKICTLLDKPERREVEIPVDYVGFQIPDEFVVGYGLDYAQKYRNLPFIGVVELENQDWKETAAGE